MHDEDHVDLSRPVAFHASRPSAGGARHDAPSPHATDAQHGEAGRLRALVHGHAAIMLVIDPGTGRIVDANEAAAEFYGWSIDALRQMRIQQINQLSPGEIAAAMAHAVSARGVSFEFRHRLADGSVRDVEVFSNPVAVDGSALLYSIIHDVGDRKRAEAALRRHEENLMHAEAFAKFGHWEVSLHDGIVRASHGAAQIYGFSELQQRLEDVQACVVSSDRPRLDDALRQLLEHDVPYDQEFWIRRVSDGVSVAVHSRAELDRARQKVFGVVQDITDRKRVETERETLIEELQHAIDHIRTLKGILPICASCKKVRDDEGYWQQVESYLAEHTDVQFSHGICPDCIRRHYPTML